MTIFPGRFFSLIVVLSNAEVRYCIIYVLLVMTKVRCTLCPANTVKTKGKKSFSVNSNLFYHGVCLVNHIIKYDIYSSTQAFSNKCIFPMKKIISAILGTWLNSSEELWSPCCIHLAQGIFPIYLSMNFFPISCH